MGERITLTASDGFTLNAYRAVPEGQPRGGVVVMMLRESAWLIGAGLGAGIVLSFLLARGASRLLFQLAPTDAATWLGAGLALASVAAIAAFVPAWRTAGLDPVTTLRGEES